MKLGIDHEVAVILRSVVTKVDDDSIEHSGPASTATCVEVKDQIDQSSQSALLRVHLIRELVH
jgi:hypothetical protein